MKKDTLLFKKGDLVHINDESYLFLVDYAEIVNGRALYEMQSLDNSILIQKQDNQDIFDNNFVLYQPIANSLNSYENFSIQKNTNYNYYLLDSENKIFAESDSKENIELILTYLKLNTIIHTKEKNEYKTKQSSVLGQLNSRAIDSPKKEKKHITNDLIR